MCQFPLSCGCIRKFTPTTSFLFHQATRQKETGAARSSLPPHFKWSKVGANFIELTWDAQALGEHYTSVITRLWSKPDFRLSTNELYVKCHLHLLHEWLGISTYCAYKPHRRMRSPLGIHSQGSYLHKLAKLVRINGWRHFVNFRIWICRHIVSSCLSWKHECRLKFASLCRVIRNEIHMETPYVKLEKSLMFKCIQISRWLVPNSSRAPEP